MEYSVNQMIELELNQLRNDIEKLKIIFEASKEGMFYMDSQFNVRFYNTTFYENFDVDTGHSTLEDWLKLIHPEDRIPMKKKVGIQTSENIEKVYTQYRVINKLGHYIWIEALGKSIFDEENNFLFMVGSHTDISERKAYEKKILQMAYQDNLTGLFNRNRMKEILEQELACGNAGFIVYLDLINFQAINRTLSFRMGDEVLQAVGEKLKLYNHGKYDVARLENDDFMMLFKDEAEDEIEAHAIALLNILRENICYQKRIINLDARIGIIQYPSGNDDADEIIQNGALLISSMRDHHMNGYLSFCDEIKSTIVRKMRIEHQLFRAIERKEFYLAYQPIVDLSSKSILGYEALLRWKNGELGEISPAEFIPIAERNSMINPIGDYVLTEACRFGKKLMDMGKPLRISVNISAIQLLQSDFVKKVIAIIEETGFEKNLLDCEITESVTLYMDDKIMDRIRALHDNGIRISLDDFGTGYSSIMNIVNLPLSYLKIDKSIIQKVLESNEAILLIELLSNFSHQANYKIIAEGIENASITDKMIHSRIDYGQGYHFSKPKKEQEVLEILFS